MKTPGKYWLSPILLCLLVTLLGAACGKAVTTGYRTYTLQEGVGHLSIEYPARFNVTTVQLLEAEKYTIETTAEVDRLYFEHLLATFKLLN